MFTQWTLGRMHGPHGNSQATHTHDNAKGYSFQIDSEALLLKTATTQLIEHGEFELVPTWSLHISMF